MDVTHILSGLNEKQRAAVSAPQQNTLVLAGAGSGKTRVLVHRIAWLLQVEGVSPQGVLAVTFTNKAAREMRGRIETLLKLSTQGMWVGTFHGIAHRLLKAHWQDAGLPQNFQILDADDQLRLIKRIMKEMRLDESRWPPRQAQWFINQQKDEGIRAASMETVRGDPFHNTHLDIYRTYEDACRAAGWVDFGELLLRSHELWLQHPSLLRHYQQRFRHLLVDEFQDTNTIQYAWLRVLAGTQIPITVVGDDDQSIYGWRGAKVENIHQFNKDFAPAELVRLEQNYRSTSTILNAANQLIGHNQGRLGKELWTDGGDGEPIDLYAAFNEQDEARYIVDRVEQWVQQGNLRGDIALLYRSNAQSRVLEEAMVRAGVPYRVYGGLRFYDRLEIKNAIAYLRLIYSRDDDAAVERVINVPTRGIGNKTLDKLREAASTQQCSLWQAMQRALAAKALPGRAANAVTQFVHCVEALAEDWADASLPQLMERAVKQSGLLEFHRQEKGEKAQTRVENLEELLGASRDYSPEAGEEPLASFLAQVALDAGEAQADAHEDSVQLMTLHAAKGLEFPLVFLTGMEENLFPSSQSVEEPGRLEEERRLCYVGVTRAMQKLVLTYAEARRLYGKEAFNGVSRFVRELPQEALQEVRLRNSVTRPTHLQPGLRRGQAATDHAWQLGQRVNHPMFGAGVILNFEGQGANTCVEVNFENVGSKMLVLSHAKLEAM